MNAILRPADLTADADEALAERIEDALERSGNRGMTPARAARAARCTTSDARHALAFLAGRQRATTGARWTLNRFYTPRRTA